jgi:electron transport complex protein RnfE
MEADARQETIVAPVEGTAKEPSRVWTDFTNALGSENPVLRLILGMCPTLAVSTSVQNALGMGVAVIFVLVGSNAMVSALRRVIPDQVRIPVYIVIIASFVTVVDLGIAALSPDLYNALGIFIPLIVVNCIILARAEVFAGKNPVGRSIADGLGMGIGFTWALVLLGGIREILGSGTVLGFPVFDRVMIPLLGMHYVPMIAFILPAGAFLVLGFMVAYFNYRTLGPKKVETGHSH